MGAGLYNSIFSSEAHIVGISSPSYMMDWLPQLTAYNILSYSIYFGTDFDFPELIYHNSHNNFIIDINNFTKFFNSLLNTLI